MEEKKLFFIFVFFVHNKYYYSFITPWCHIDYFNNVLTTFLGLEHVSCIAVYAGVRIKKLLDFLQNIYICVPKMNEGFTVYFIMNKW